jgi:hypothetical protein
MFQCENTGRRYSSTFLGIELNRIIKAQPKCRL